MKLPLCSPILLFILLGTSAGIRFNADIFVDLILDVRKFYSAASVIFVHPGDMYGDYGDLRITHLIHTTTRLLSRRYIITADVHFKKLWRTLKYYHQVTQPITVVIIPDFEAYLEFADAVKTYPMSFPVWFILFLYTPDNSTYDHCREPIGNPFNLRFDTQMLVLCNNETIFREWYSIKGDIIKIFDLAEWRDDKGFIPLTNLSLYERRKDMEGVVLRAVAAKSLFSTIDGNQVATIYGKVLEELTSSLNFTVKIVSQINEHGVQNQQTLTWSGVMGKIVSGRADFAVADMSLTSLRKRYVDFTLPLIVSRINLYIKEPGICGVKWIGYFQTFNPRTWATIIILIATVPLLLFFMKSYRDQSRSAMDLIFENFICIWGIFCQQALTEFPKNLSLRVAYITIFLTAMLIMAHYSAALICFLTVCTRVLPFQTLEEFIDDGTYKLIMIRGTADYEVVTFQAQHEAKLFYVKLMKLMKDESELPRNLEEGFMQVCNEKNVAFMVLSARKKSVEKEIPCKLSSITTERIDNLAMVLSKNNPYTGVINYHLQKFLNNGMIMRLRETYSQLTEDKIYKPVYLFNVVPILAILCGGFIISIMIMIIEKIHYRSRKKFQSRVFYPSRKLFIKKYNN
ncbi:glutamate receptor 1 [Mycetomoellerius zeteki]|nr:PREDICTED: glutamate receptor 1-like [Trachymyrmex zeteki]